MPLEAMPELQRQYAQSVLRRAHYPCAIVQCSPVKTWFLIENFTGAYARIQTPKAGDDNCVLASSFQFLIGAR